MSMFMKIKPLQWKSANTGCIEARFFVVTYRIKLLPTGSVSAWASERVSYQGYVPTEAVYDGESIAAAKSACMAHAERLLVSVNSKWATFTGQWLRGG